MDYSVMLSGNLGCVAYYFTKYLRKRGVDATLYMWNWELKMDPRNPLKADLNIDELPDWIRFFSSVKKASSEHKNAAREHDIIHSFNTDPVFAQQTGKTFISHPVGSDAREFAFEKGIQPRMLRRAYRKNDAFFLSQCDYYRTVLPKLKIKNVVNIPPIHNYAPEIDIEPGLPERDSVEMVFFHPTSQNWTIKGNQMLIEAYARFVKDLNPSSMLVMVDWGDDIAKSKILVEKLGIGNHVTFKKWLGKVEYYRYMKNSDMILDQFIIPSSSTIQREANALGKTVMKHSDDFWFKMYSSKPFISAGTVDDIYNGLVGYYKNPEDFRIMGESGKDFILKNNHWKSVTDKVIAEYEKILGSQ